MRNIQGCNSLAFAPVYTANFESCIREDIEKFIESIFKTSILAEIRVETLQFCTKCEQNIK